MKASIQVSKFQAVGVATSCLCVSCVISPPQAEVEKSDAELAQAQIELKSQIRLLR